MPHGLVKYAIGVVYNRPTSVHEQLYFIKHTRDVIVPQLITHEYSTWKGVSEYANVQQWLPS